jgi:hypothetical protein
MQNAQQIKDRQGVSIAEPPRELSLETNNFKLLKPEETEKHLSLLEKNILLLHKLITTTFPECRSNTDLQSYLMRLSGTIGCLALRHKLESMTANADVAFQCSIDPTDSGYPIFARDFLFLRKDKEKAVDLIKYLPTEGQLVNDAISALFGGVYPHKTILKKFTRDYNIRLANLELPEDIRFHKSDIAMDKASGMNLLKISVERLDTYSTIPRFYTFYLNIPSRALGDRDYLTEELVAVVSNGVLTAADYGLHSLAKNIEKIDGLQMQMLERFDIGPFYSHYTDNEEPIHSLIGEDDTKNTILKFRRYYVVRVGNIEKKGLKNWFRGMFSGDDMQGLFSSTIQSPQYLLMPHRMIQTVYNQRLDFRRGENKPEEIKMYGVASDGDLVE